MWHKLCAGKARQVYVSGVDSAAGQSRQVRVVSKEETFQPSGPAGQSLGLKSDELAASQKSDRYIARLYSAVASGRPKPERNDVSHWSLSERVYWRQWDRLAIRDGVLCRRFETAGERQCIWQVLLPESYRAAAINLAHSSTTRGHCGRSETYERVMRRAFWCGWQKDVKSALRNCALCTQSRHSTRSLQMMERNVDKRSASKSAVENDVAVSGVNQPDGAGMQPTQASHQFDEQQRDQSSGSESAALLTDEDTPSRMDGHDSSLTKQRNCENSVMLHAAAMRPEYYARYVDFFDQLNCWSPPPVK